MRTSNQYVNYPVGDAVIAASRQVWLASLGAAVVTRDWAQAEASNVFRSLVKQGTAVESRTIRLVGNRLEGSFTRANSMWKETRSTVQSTVRQMADTAVMLVQTNMPKALPKVTLPAMLTPKAPAKTRKTRKTVAKTKRTVTKRAAKAVKPVKRSVKRATKK